MNQVSVLSKGLLCLTLLLISCVTGCTYETVDEAVPSPLDAGIDSESPMPRGFSTDNEMVMGDSHSKTAINVARFNRLPVDPNQPEFDSGVVSADQYTVQIGIDQEPNAAEVNGPPNLRATIRWNTAGKQITRLVSVGGGTSVSGSAEGVSVSIQDFSGEPNRPDLADYKVVVTVVPGSRASTSAAPTLIPLTTESTPRSSFGGVYNIPLNNDVLINVPPNLGVQSVYVTSGFYVGDDTETNPSLYLYQIDSAGNALKVTLVNPGYGFIPLSPQCNQIKLINNPPRGGVNAQIDAASLTWGIDG